MHVPLQITLRNLRQSDALEERIRRKTSKLEALGHRVQSLAVTIEQGPRGQRNGREYAVRLDVRVPGHEIVVNREHDEDLNAALRDAFDAATRQLDSTARIERGEVKTRSTT